MMSRYVVLASPLTQSSSTPPATPRRNTYIARMYADPLKHAGYATRGHIK
jgi:hypothetical protein